MISKRRKNIAKGIAFICLFILAVIWMIPLIWGLGTSLKTNADIANNTVGLIPSPGEWTFSRYINLFTSKEYPVLRWLLNSFIVSGSHTLIYLIIISMAAYAFVFFRFKWRNQIFFVILATMMIPGIINIVPLYTMIVDFGWTHSLIALIVPSLGGVFGLFIVRSFFLGIPKDLIESSRIDGASNLQIFFRVVLPLGKSALMVAALFAFMGTWNDFLWPQVVMMGEPDRNKWTLPVGLNYMNGAINYDYGLVMAAAILSSVPVMIVYAFTQNKIIEGVSRTGIK